MKNAHSRIGFVSSVVLHTGLFGGLYWLAQTPNTQPATETVSSISMEMMAAMLEQPTVAVALEEPTPPEVKEAPVEEKPLEEALLPEPIPTPEPPPKPQPKPIEKPIEKPKEKPKKKAEEKPKVEKKIEKKVEKKPIQALEKGSTPQEGVVAKAEVAQAKQAQQGIVQGSKGNQTVQSGQASGGELDAYKAQLQRMLQQRANRSYPQREKMMRKTGTVTLRFNLSPNGQVVNVVVANSSGNQNLDNAAAAAAQSTKMPSAPPAGFPSQLIVPIRFALSD